MKVLRAKNGYVTLCYESLPAIEERTLSVPLSVVREMAEALGFGLVPSSTIQEARELTDEIQGAVDNRISTGIPAIDQVLSEGLPKGALVTLGADLVKAAKKGSDE